MNFASWWLDNWKITNNELIIYSLEKLLVEAQNEAGETKEVKKAEEITPQVDKKIQNSVGNA